MSYLEKIDKTRLPQHIAIIMDGNGRWAKERNMERTYGHKYGVDAVRTVTEAAVEIGVKYLTLYTFSTENWSRPDEEITALMALMVMAIEAYIDIGIKLFFPVGNYGCYKTHCCRCRFGTACNK